jgi:hypothetical protein
MMETVLDSPEPAILQRDRFIDQETNWAVAMSIDVDADARRIFQALTLPEYLETWIRLPEHTERSQVIASLDSDGYTLDHCCAGRRTVSIKSCYIFCHQRKMRLSWRKTCHSFRSDSVVDFRLRGNFASSILELRHFALDSASELIWHKKFWQRSLEKLASLLR